MSMYKTNFIITYDISCEKRLRKIAKLLEKNALRIQKSVYLYKGATKENLYDLLQNVLELLNEKEDDLRVYKIKKGSINLQNAIDLDYPEIFKENT